MSGYNTFPAVHCCPETALNWWILGSPSLGYGPPGINWSLERHEGGALQQSGRLSSVAAINGRPMAALVTRLSYCFEKTPVARDVRVLYLVHQSKRTNTKNLNLSQSYARLTISLFHHIQKYESLAIIMPGMRKYI